MGQNIIIHVRRMGSHMYDGSVRIPLHWHAHIEICNICCVAFSHLTRAISMHVSGQMDITLCNWVIAVCYIGDVLIDSNMRRENNA